MTFDPGSTARAAIIESLWQEELRLSNGDGYALLLLGMRGIRALLAGVFIERGCVRGFKESLLSWLA